MVLVQPQRVRNHNLATPDSQTAQRLDILYAAQDEATTTVDLLRPNTTSKPKPPVPEVDLWSR